MTVSHGTLKRGGGRPKGARNKVAMEVKEMVEQALVAAGGHDYLLKQARKNPRAFMVLVSKLIPRDLNVSGEVRHTLEKLLNVGLLSGARPEPESAPEKPASVQ